MQFHCPNSTLQQQHLAKIKHQKRAKINQNTQMVKTKNIMHLFRYIDGLYI